MAGAFNDLVQAGLRRIDAAQLAGPGSVASRNDPNIAGSIMARTLPGAFGQFGALNPEYQQSAAAYHRALPPPVAAANTQAAATGPLAQSPYTQGVRDYMTNGLKRAPQIGIPPGMLPTAPSITASDTSTGDDADTAPNAGEQP
jgi:hypothetical protein